MFAMGGPVRMEEGGTPGGIVAAAQAMGISVEELMKRIREAERRVFAERALRNSPRISLSDFERMKEMMPLREEIIKRTYDSFDQLSKSEKDLVEEAKEKMKILGSEAVQESPRISTSDFERMKEMMPRQEGMRGIPRDTFDQLSPEDQNKVLGKKSFVESQPEGALKGTFFDYIPDAYQMSDYLRQFFTKEPKGMAAGGEPMMAQQAAMMPPPMPQAPMPQDPSMDQAMAQAAQVGVDPAVVEGMLSQVSGGIGNLDEAEDFEQVMNSMRGDEAPISERYAELAEVVGEEDAEATPESVLALVQPVMQMAQVDQGIGGLAQEEMTDRKSVV